MDTQQNRTIPVRPGTKLVISESINYEVTRTEGVAWEWEINGPTIVTPSTHWLRPNSLKLTVPAGQSCNITIKVPPGITPRITRCK